MTRTGSRLSPLVKFVRWRTGSPASSTRSTRCDELLEVDAQLEAREVRPEALVRTTPPERQMVGRVARDVEPMRVRIVVGVAVAGGEPDDDLVAGGDLDVADA